MLVIIRKESYEDNVNNIDPVNQLYYVTLPDSAFISLELPAGNYEAWYPTVANAAGVKIVSY